MGGSKGALWLGAGTSTRPPATLLPAPASVPATSRPRAMRARAVLVALLASASAAFAARAPAPAPQLPSLPPDVDFVPLPTPVATAVAAAQAADAARDAVAAGKALSAAPSNWTAAGGRLNSTEQSVPTPPLAIMGCWRCRHSKASFKNATEMSTAT